MLIGTNLYDEITKSRRKLQKIFDLLSVELDDFTFTFSQFCFCSMLVQSRSFQLDTFAIVPYADMLNHSDESNGTFSFDKETNCFTIRATKDIKRGEEVCLFYGARKQKFF